MTDPSAPPRPRRFLEDSTFATVPPGEAYPASLFLEIARDAFAAMWAPRTKPNIFRADAFYVAPSLQEAKAIIHKSHLDAQQWVDDSFDCDDFAIVLKSNFSQAAYFNGTRKGGFAFGIIWLTEPSGHAMNWMINDDGILRFVEPQRPVESAIIEPQDFHRSGISLAVL